MMKTTITECPLNEPTPAPATPLFLAMMFLNAIKSVPYSDQAIPLPVDEEKCPREEDIYAVD